MTEKVVIGNATLYHGDCREVLPMLPKHDLLLTDPPYGISDKWGKKRISKNGDSSLCFGPEEWDECVQEENIVIAIDKCIVSIIWGGNYYKSIWPSRGYLIWDKLQKFDGSESELAWTNIDVASKTFGYSRAQIAHHEYKVHPTQKPLPLMLWCIGFAMNSGDVLDPFMGSGTTGVACAQLGKAFTGIERERKYFDIACERIERAQAQGQLIPNETPQPVQESLLDNS